MTGNCIPCDGRLHAGQLDGRQRRYRVYFPLMRRLKSLAIGAREPLTAAPADAKPAIVYYGTSIVHGSSVSRSGMTHAAQLGRMLDRPVYNLGFCGRARCELLVAETLARIETPLYLVDVLPNNTAEELHERLPSFLRLLRERRPDTPILLVEDRLFGDASFVVGRAQEQAEKNAALHRIIAELEAVGLTGLHLASHPSWYGDDFEGTVDGSHPSDLGAWRLAQALVPCVRELLSP